LVVAADVVPGSGYLYVEAMDGVVYETSASSMSSMSPMRTL